MPTYAYRCKSCGHRFERHQTFAERTLKVCPRCHKWTLQRVIPLVRIAFKGSGFYSTDNKAGSSRKAKKKRTSEKKTQSDDAAATTSKKPEDASTTSEKPGDASPASSKPTDAAPTSTKPE
jgi:putative FmdB family regulatory protein